MQDHNGEKEKHGRISATKNENKPPGVDVPTRVNAMNTKKYNEMSMLRVTRKKARANVWNNKGDPIRNRLREEKSFLMVTTP